MKKFSKLTILYQIGCLQRKFDGKEFRKSKLLYIRSYLIIFLSATMPLKLLISLYFPQRDKMQLYIGNLYNYMGPNSRIFMGIVGKLSLLTQFVLYLTKL